ncbi:MAG: ribonuclease H-like domain-containing protein [Deltaproteobacteria bacterium]|nr:ribonuclease H-like domain-containing protein [Deltaproteobacteria bacterium]
MSLGRKLARLEAEGRRPSQKDAAPISAARGTEDADKSAVLGKLRATLAQMEARGARHRTPRKPPAPVPGEARETSHGPVQWVERRYDAEARHGDAEVGAGRTASAQALASVALDPAFRELDVARALYVDTETTGLAGGAGTVPFLIGFARFDAAEFVVEQCLLRRLGEEAPMLGVLAERIAAASMIVSYNGKSFDWPLLRTRFVLARVPVPRLPPHLDLLHASRRLFKPRLGRTRLQDMERELLGYERVGDIDGALIPRVFFDFLKGRDQGQMADVVRHNQDDLVALAALLGRLSALAQEGRDCDAPEDELAMARVLLRAGEEEGATRFAERAAAGVSERVGAEAELLLAQQARRRGDVEACQRALERAVAIDADEQITAAAHLALAKLHEHKFKDLERALRHAHLAEECEGEEASAYRVARLERKLASRRAALSRR